MNAPCRVLILIQMPNGARKQVRIARTGYGLERHVDRWMAKGAERVKAFGFSLSTGKEVSTLEKSV